MSKIEDAIQNAKENLPNLTPTPPPLKAESSAHDLKQRLEWGEPALTIIDVRDRDSFNRDRIMGALQLPMTNLVEEAKANLEDNRDIYVYGATDAETAQAAAQLRQAGFQQVAELRGGLDAWKAIAGSTEGSEAGRSPTPESAYNVVAQVQHQQNTQSRRV